MVNPAAAEPDPTESLKLEARRVGRFIRKWRWPIAGVVTIVGLGLGGIAANKYIFDDGEGTPDTYRLEVGGIECFDDPEAAAANPVRHQLQAGVTYEVRAGDSDDGADIELNGLEHVIATPRGEGRVDERFSEGGEIVEVIAKNQRHEIAISEAENGQLVAIETCERL